MAYLDNTQKDSLTRYVDIAKWNQIQVCALKKQDQFTLNTGQSWVVSYTGITAVLA